MTDSLHPVALDDAQLYKALVAELTDFAVCLLDEGGRNASWNLGVERLLGYTEAEWVGHLISIIFTPEDRAAQRSEKEMAEAILNGRAPDFGWRLRKDGSLFAVESVLVARGNDCIHRKSHLLMHSEGKASWARSRSLTCLPAKR